MYYFAHGYMMDGGDYGHGDSAWGLLFMLLITILLILGAVLAVRFLSERSKPTDDALNTLRNRYAKGEIDKKQFNDMKKDIK